MKTLQGVITSLKTAQTATVTVHTKWQHPMYKKYVSRSKKYACHYEDMTLAEGDEVMIEECRPLSKTKHFKVVKKIEKK
jgi:small subunit ribosomal protein S17